jgi:hypothetical protein
MTSSDLISRDGDLIFAEVDGEAVALSAARGLCYGLDGIGLRVLQLIESPATLGEICDRLVEEYDVDRTTCEKDVADLIGSLAAEGLVNVRQGVHTP